MNLFKKLKKKYKVATYEYGVLHWLNDFTLIKWFNIK